jgi:hypothetical protein
LRRISAFLSDHSMNQSFTAPSAPFAVSVIWECGLRMSISLSTPVSVNAFAESKLMPTE